RQLPLRAIAQAVAAFGYNHFAGLESRGHRNSFAVDHAQGHGTHAHAAVRIDDVDERGGHTVWRASAHGRVRHDDLIGEHVLQQLNVDKLIWKQRRVRVVELRAQLDGAGRDVDRI